MDDFVICEGKGEGVKDYLYGTTMRWELLRRFVALR